MSEEELARANARLRGEESFLLAPTRFLGHYVVGQLAQQMSADVQMAPSPVTGVTARVMLPASILATPTAINPSEISTPEAVAAEAIRDEIPAPVSVPIPAEIIGQTEIVSQPVGLSTSVPSQRAIGVRPAPVVEYITLPDSEGPGAIGTGVFEPIAPMRLDNGAGAGEFGRTGLDGAAAGGMGRNGVGGETLAGAGPAGAGTAGGGTASGVASVGSAYGFDGARSGSAPVGASGMPPGTRIGAAGSGPGGTGPGNSTPGFAGTPERTANGLLKRPPRNRSGAVTGRATAVSAATDHAERPPVADESPDAMRSRLSALRAGVYRGETDRESAGGQPGGSGGQPAQNQNMGGQPSAGQVPGLSQQDSQGIPVRLPDGERVGDTGDGKYGPGEGDA
jgi:hypothetical protein